MLNLQFRYFFAIEKIQKLGRNWAYPEFALEDDHNGLTGKSESKASNSRLLWYLLQLNQLGWHAYRLKNSKVLLNKVYNIFYKKKNQIKWYFSKHNLKLSRMLPFLGCFKNHSSCSPHHSCWMLHGQVPVTIIKLIQTNISYEIIKKLGKSFQSEIFGKIHDFWEIHDFLENTWVL